MDAYWRAANCPSVGQIYLLENPLLREMPVIRQQTVREHPEIAQILAELKDKISDEEMRRFNYAVDGQHRDAKEAVREFLRSKGLLQ
jgi:osmoprotectant transport system permease protein